MRPSLGALVLLLGACGPIEYIATIPLEASGAVGEAKHMKADKYAPYEVTAATEYLHKARELGGFARFHDSMNFGQKATKLAKEAQQISHEKAMLPEEQRESSSALGDQTGATIVQPGQK